MFPERASDRCWPARRRPAPRRPRRAVRPVPRVVPGRQILLKGGTVLSLDPKVGDFDTADVLIDGRDDHRGRTEPQGVPPAPSSSTRATSIVMPGSSTRIGTCGKARCATSFLNGLLSDYTRDITGAARAVFRPEDAYIGDLVSALGAINAGVTTVLDWSHIGNSPEHTDAAIDGLRESGCAPSTRTAAAQPGRATSFRRTSSGCAGSTSLRAISC